MEATRSTSRMALDQMEAGGLLSARRLEVYRMVVSACERRGTATAAEVAEDLFEEHPQGLVAGIERLKSSHKRISELVALGLVEQVEVRTCRATGRKATAYKPTGLALEVRDGLVLAEALGPTARGVIVALEVALKRYCAEDECNHPTVNTHGGCACDYCLAQRALILADRYMRRRPARRKA
jgi:hypothetical protein